MKNDCLFCTIAHGDKEQLIWENGIAAAFKDIHPKAPIHVLVVSKRHVQSLDALDDPILAGQLLMAVRQVAKELGVSDGYRVVMNTGRRGGQLVDHLHFHILAGKEFHD